jgi:hypothetical protein
MKFLVILALLGVVTAFRAAAPRASTTSTKLSQSSRFDTPVARPYTDEVCFHTCM